MICPKCGAPMAVRSVHNKSALSEALNEQRRIRECEYGHATDTVEITRQELQSLRAMAHMGGKP